MSSARTRLDVIATANYYAKQLLAALEQIEPEDMEDPTLTIEFGALHAAFSKIADHPAMDTER